MHLGIAKVRGRFTRFGTRFEVDDAATEPLRTGRAIAAELLPGR